MIKHLNAQIQFTMNHFLILIVCLRAVLRGGPRLALPRSRRVPVLRPQGSGFFGSGVCLFWDWACKKRAKYKLVERMSVPCFHWQSVSCDNHHYHLQTAA